MEIWKDIVGYEGWYQISNTGVVRSLDRVIADGRKQKGRQLKYTIGWGGYFLVELNKNGKPFKVSVHRLVAITFIPNPENKPQVNHKDGNKHNNNLENLEWCTAKENSRHCIDILKISAGRLSAPKKYKPVYQYTKSGEFIKLWESVTSTKDYGFDLANISSCCRGKASSHLGFVWSYRSLTMSDISKINFISGETAKPVYRIGMDGKVLERFESGWIAEEKGYSRNKISSCCNGRNKTHMGFYWSFDQSTPLEQTA